MIVSFSTYLCTVPIMYMRYLIIFKVDTFIQLVIPKV